MEQLNSILLLVLLLVAIGVNCAPSSFNSDDPGASLAAQLGLNDEASAIKAINEMKTPPTAIGSKPIDKRFDDDFKNLEPKIEALKKPFFQVPASKIIQNADELINELESKSKTLDDDWRLAKMLLMARYQKATALHNEKKLADFFIEYHHIKGLCEKFRFCEGEWVAQLQLRLSLGPDSLLKSDPWSILGVDRSANSTSVKKAYRNLMLKLHPDKISHMSKETQEYFGKLLLSVQKAYKLITESMA